MLTKLVGHMASQFLMPEILVKHLKMLGMDEYNYIAPNLSRSIALVGIIFYTKNKVVGLVIYPPPLFQSLGGPCAPPPPRPPLPP